MTRISRYQGLQVRERLSEDGRPVRYLERRFLPQPSRIARTIEPGPERLDNLAARLLGDPTLYWQICDESHVLAPAELEQAAHAEGRIGADLPAPESA